MFTENTHYFSCFIMEVILVDLLEKKLNLPFDIAVYIYKYIEYEKITDTNLRVALKLWYQDNYKCKLIYGHISYWNTS